MERSLQRESKVTMKALLTALGSSLLLAACTPTPPQAGPDKQAGGMMQGAVTGAGAGAVTGFQVGAGTGPGALVGAGLGAVAGTVHGMLQDASEDAAFERARLITDERDRSYATQVLAEHFKRRQELHPGRDIFPADLFFDADEVKLRPSAIPLVKEMARLNKRRVPWSRLVVASYAKSVDGNTTYAEHLGERRAREIVDFLVAGGIEPRRLETRAVVMEGPLVIDPLDNPLRYNQAIELIAVDK